MRILFVSGTATGGAFLSTQELADRLAARGHTVGLVARSRRVDVGLESRFSRWRSRKGPARVVRTVERLLLRRPPAPEHSSHGPVWTVRHLETQAPPLIDDFGPDVIVVNTVHARAWATLRGHGRDGGPPIVLYVREHGSVRHVASGAAPDLVVANAHSHAHAIARLGREAVVIPSVVDLARIQVASTRTKVLCINPTPTRGLDVALATARLRPDLRFVFQESHRLSRQDHRILTERFRGFPNVELREYTDDRPQVYRDAAVLLLPYQVDNRPRVVLEAQANGVPVVATDRPGLDECVGPGGRLVGATDPPEAWAAALGEVLDDPDRYTDFVEAARSHAERDEVAPDVLAERFESALLGVVSLTMGLGR